jgi:exonuclease SbcC
MVKENINIEFMFLDEGFGTLDLNTLLNVLDVIKDATKGKVVGIISHVEVLKEEIEDKIILG